MKLAEKHNAISSFGLFDVSLLPTYTNSKKELTAST